MSAISLVIPDLIEAEEIGHLAKFIASVDANIPLTLTSYFAVPNCSIRSASDTEVEAAVEVARKYLVNVYSRTLSMDRIGEPAQILF